MTSWTDLIKVGTDVLTLLLTFGILPLLRYVQKMKSNDLKHIDGKLDEVKEDVRAVGKKLDDHITWHLNRQ